MSTDFDYSYWKTKKSSQPEAFQSPYKVLREIISDKNFTDDIEYLNLASALKRENLKQLQELKKTGELKLTSGHSYEFNLQGFCIHAGVEQGLKGDGGYPGKLDFKSRKWLPKILQSYYSKGIFRKDTQTLIWGLLAGNRFDNLSSRNQKNLLKIYPDASIRFGSRFVESQFEYFAESFLPSNLKEIVSFYDELRSGFQENQDRYNELEAVFAPPTDRVEVIDPVWALTE